MNEIIYMYLLCNVIITGFMYDDVMNLSGYTQKRKLLGILTLVVFGLLLLIYALVERFIEEWREYDD